MRARVWGAGRCRVLFLQIRNPSLPTGTQKSLGCSSSLDLNFTPIPVCTTKDQQAGQPGTRIIQTSLRWSLPYLSSCC
jgi:hypothetical protein